MSDFEKPQKNNENGLDPKNSIEFTRHSVSSYQSYVDKVASDNPLGKLDYDKQSVPDLPEKGIELARQSAEKFFETLDPSKDALFFASSNEARAVETANIYREIAHDKGFEVLKPENSRSVLSEQIADGEIRVVHNLGIRSAGVIDSVFQSPNKRVPINWETIDPEIKKKFDEASKIIEADDKGSFGANLAAHSEEIKRFFPELATAKEQFDIQFSNLIRLIKFGFEKAKNDKEGKDIKILAFGHENYLMYALEHYFQEEGIKNCETIHIEPQDEGIKIVFRGKEIEIK
jgi:hypothetical protein